MSKPYNLTNFATIRTSSLFTPTDIDLLFHKLLATMKKLHTYLIAIAFLGVSPLKAQDLQQEVGNWYWNNRFATADVNKNGVLSKEELLAFPSEFSYYLNENYFRLSDANQDGNLSNEEVSARQTAEFAYRMAMEKREIRKLQTEFTNLANADVHFLKENIDLTAKLFQNYSWLMDNMALAQSLYKDKDFIKKNEKLALALSTNLCWMASNPSEAQNLYEGQKEMLKSPALLGWRSNHLKFIRQNPALKAFYHLDGYDAIIKVSK